ncbi:hypothetical protein PCANC_24616 [Puccinia coronata f. sp. avenae]|uniref:Uncharacterized protein n=1 Tax=Puccinia coronata f. sp. avenae TaxID=200324 RepID=A0A2N5UKQ4_9BASI|nr:hypothetical protein PCANC_24616 [Puccinia coronata f. sp. avenae]
MKLAKEFGDSLAAVHFEEVVLWWAARSVAVHPHAVGHHGPWDPSHCAHPLSAKLFSSDHDHCYILGIRSPPDTPLIKPLAKETEILAEERGALADGINEMSKRKLPNLKASPSIPGRKSISAVEQEFELYRVPLHKYSESVKQVHTKELSHPALSILAPDMIIANATDRAQVMDTLGWNTQLAVHAM